MTESLPKCCICDVQPQYISGPFWNHPRTKCPLRGRNFREDQWRLLHSGAGEETAFKDGFLLACTWGEPVTQDIDSPAFKAELDAYVSGHAIGPRKRLQGGEG